MHILVTRPAEDAVALTRILEAAGHRVTLAPLMTIQPVDPPLGAAELDRALGGCQALVFTSANGLRAFVGLSNTRDLPVFAVGDATARAARAEGFRDVMAAGGDVHSLAALLVASLNPAHGPLFHAAGKIIAGDLGLLLAPHGFDVRRRVLYSAEAETTLPPQAVRALTQDLPDIALFYSPRTARIFMDLVARAGLLDRLSGVTAGALSLAVAKALESGSWPLHSPGWRRIVTAADPSEAALLAALGL